MAQPPGGGYLSHRRQHRTRASVRVGEIMSRVMITLGGIGTIVAVCGVFLFLVWVAKDLFLPADVGTPQKFTSAADVLRIGADEYRVIGWILRRDAKVELVGLVDGKHVATIDLADEELPAITAVSEPHPSERDEQGRAVLDLALGFADGTVRPLVLRFSTTYHELEDVPAELRSLQPGTGQVAHWREGVVERTPVGQFRLQVVTAELGEATRFGDAAIVAIDRSHRTSGPIVAALTAGGKAIVRAAEQRENLLTMESETVWGDPIQLALQGRDPPRFIAITDLGTNVAVAWPDGRLERHSIRELAHPALAESVDVVPPDAELTAFGLLLGSATILVGDSRGRVSGWFLVNDPDNGVDGTSLVAGHRFQLDAGDPVRCFGSSARQRTFLVGSERGVVHALFMTSEKHLARVQMKGGGPVSQLAVAPKDDALLVATPAGLWQMEFDPGYPEVTLGSLFGKVWYERSQAPAYSWQSSSGSDAFEKKLSFVPLVFGTIKATVYSMLFAVPLALLAAVYTSEFLSRRTRARLKPLIEMMASLPSVVLGFLAAIVLAPFIEDFVPDVLAAAATIPLSVLLGAYVWRMLPRSRALELARWRMAIQLAFLLLGCWLATVVGGPLEQVLFAGDIKLWLDSERGSGLTGWIVALLPFAAVAVAAISIRYVNPWLRRRTAGLDETAAGAAHLGKFLVGILLAGGIAVALAAVVYWAPTWFDAPPLDLRKGLDVAGFDLSPLGRFEQRNALVVGFIMGFAVIPIVYTIAEDALSAVPEHLRAASLGAGATPWQTAVRIVIPTAMSGLFSAVMIGLGRAVGETMIVLMATGSTPVLSMNAFNGFRTLSANIATELPEAARDSTHYRTLFLAALVLFAMTFFINTIAEGVRLRFRRRAYQL